MVARKKTARKPTKKREGAIKKMVIEPHVGIHTNVDDLGHAPKRTSKKKHMDDRFDESKYNPE